MPGPVYQHLLRACRASHRFLWLLDPEKINLSSPDPRWELAAECGVAAFLVGSSQDGGPEFAATVALIRRHTTLPLILFPGSAAQVTPHVDAVLFLTLLSGRNPDFLVGQQVRGTPLVRQYGIEPIPTGYLLIGIGSTTSVARRSGTLPLPQQDIEVIRNHALCAEYMGQALVYLEAGSGAEEPISPTVIAAVRREISIPLIVGGGIRTPERCAAAIGAGADFVVVGTALERDRTLDLLQRMCEAAGSRDSGTGHLKALAESNDPGARGARV